MISLARNGTRGQQPRPEGWGFAVDEMPARRSPSTFNAICAMSTAKWRRELLELVDNIEHNLCASAPKSARSALGDLRVLIHTSGKRKAVAKVEAVIDSQAYFRGAYSRYIRAKFVEVVEGLEQLVGLAKEWNQMRAAWVDVAGQKYG